MAAVNRVQVFNRLIHLNAHALRKLEVRVQRVCSRKMSSQLTDRVMMVRPSLFSSNMETVGDNAFQSDLAGANADTVHNTALGEFNAFTGLLKEQGIQVNVVQDTMKLPDAIFPNNWVSFHSPPVGGHRPTIVLYPMMSPLRRLERNPDVIQRWVEELGADVRDYSAHENEGKFLEGTGSMVLDREHRIAYACLSQRTNPDLLDYFCKDFDFKLVSFRANSIIAGTSSPIYHTNVMMSVGTTFALVCLDSIMDTAEQRDVCDSLTATGKEIVSLSMQQILSFAGNTLQLKSPQGHTILVMSTKAYQSLTQEQLGILNRHSCAVVHGNLKTIETYSGGGARCMIAEVFPPLK